MAYGFGTGVQAGLGATDYSNYLRGALAGAQLEAQGQAAIGQGISSALGSIGQGIKKYQENKILQAEIMGGVEQNVDYLVKNNPEAIASANPEIQRILARMEDGKGVGLKDSALLKSWSDSTVKQTKINIDNNAFASAVSFNEDGTAPTGQQAAMRYFASGGTDKSLLGSLLAFGNNPLEMEALQARTAETRQRIEGTVPMTDLDKARIKIEEDKVAAQKAAAEAAATRQAAADTREQTRVDIAKANAEAAQGKTVEANRLEALKNQSIALFSQDEAAYNESLNALSPADRGFVIAAVNQFRRGAPEDEQLSPSAIANLLGEKDGSKGPTLAEYINNIESATGKIIEADSSGNRYVVKGLGNDIKKIPAFEQIFKKFPQLAPQFKYWAKEEDGQKTIKTPTGATLNRTG